MSEIERVLTTAWRYVLENPDRLADYGTFLSALTALVVAFIALRQLRLNSKQVAAAQDQVRVGERQVGVAIDALIEAQKASETAERARLDSYGPRVSIVLAGSEATAITDNSSHLSGPDAFGPANSCVPPPVFELWDPHSEYRFWSLHFTGKFWVENHGAATSLMWSMTRLEFDQPLAQDDRGRYLLPPGQKREVQWFEEVFLDDLIDHAERENGRNEKPYVDRKFDVWITPATHEPIRDIYTISFTCLPVFDVPRGSDQFRYDGEQPVVYLRRSDREYTA